MSVFRRNSKPSKKDDSPLLKRIQSPGAVTSVKLPAPSKVNLPKVR